MKINIKKRKKEKKKKRKKNIFCNCCCCCCWCCLHIGISNFLWWKNVKFLTILRHNYLKIT